MHVAVEEGYWTREVLAVIGQIRDLTNAEDE